MLLHDSPALGLPRLTILPFQHRRHLVKSHLSSYAQGARGSKLLTLQTAHFLAPPTYRTAFVFVTLINATH